jgi:hypothetical protein
MKRSLGVVLIILLLLLLGGVSSVIYLARRELGTVLEINAKTSGKEGPGYGGDQGFPGPGGGLPVGNICRTFELIWPAFSIACQ